jgi:hypothetical protein
LKPGSYLEEQLAYQAALSLQQWNRLHRYERAQTAHHIKAAGDDPFGDHARSQAAHTLLEAGLAAIKGQLSSVTRVIELLAILPVADPAKPIEPAVIASPHLEGDPAWKIFPPRRRLTKLVS